MLEKFGQSTGNVLGYKAIGKLTEDDYATLTADVEELLQQVSSINLLLDLESLTGEKLKAWDDDLKFGRNYRDKIDKMAMVGNKKWQERLASIADHFYAREAKFFPTTDREVAWDWVGV